jgi:hypothetical protein
MTPVSFTVGAMDLTTSIPDTAVWWSCAGCGVDVELPAAEIAGFLQPCPDCPGHLHETWRSEPGAA